MRDGLGLPAEEGAAMGPAANFHLDSARENECIVLRMRERIRACLRPVLHGLEVGKTACWTAMTGRSAMWPGLSSCSSDGPTTTQCRAAARRWRKRRSRGSRRRGGALGCRG